MKSNDFGSAFSPLDGTNHPSATTTTPNRQDDVQAGAVHRIKEHLFGILRDMLIRRRPSHKRSIRIGSHGFQFPSDHRRGSSVRTVRRASTASSIASVRSRLSFRSVLSIRTLSGISTPSVFVTLPSNQKKRKMLLHQGHAVASSARSEAKLDVKSLRYAHPTVSAVFAAGQSTRRRSSSVSSVRSWDTVEDASDRLHVSSSSARSSLSTSDLAQEFPGGVNVRQVARDSRVDVQDAKAMIDGLMPRKTATRRQTAHGVALQLSEHEKEAFASAVAGVPSLAAETAQSTADDSQLLSHGQDCSAGSRRSVLLSDDDIIAHRKITLKALEGDGAHAEGAVVGVAEETSDIPCILRPGPKQRGLANPDVTSGDSSCAGTSWYDDTPDDADQPFVRRTAPTRDLDESVTSTHSADHPRSSGLYLPYSQSFAPFQQDPTPGNIAQNVQSRMHERADSHFNGYAAFASHYSPPLSSHPTESDDFLQPTVYQRPPPPQNTNDQRPTQAKASESVPEPFNMNANGFPILASRQAVYSAEPKYERRSLIEDEIKLRKREEKQKAKKLAKQGDCKQETTKVSNLNRLEKG